MPNASANKNGHTNLKPVIFAVDDEPMLLELLTLVLEPLGFQVKTFRDPASAVRAFVDAEAKPDLIITDFAMHRMTGLDLIRECRRVAPRQKIIMVSGTVDPTVFRDSPQKPDAFLAKPYPATEIADLVMTVLAR